MESRLVNWLRGAIGQKLIAVLALVYVYEGEKEFLNPQELNIQFSSGRHGKFMCSCDGSSIDWQEEEIRECDMEEFGSQVIENLSKLPKWQSVVDKVLVGAALIRSSVEASLIGVQLSFEGSSSISVLNLGDELYVYQDIPDEVICDQGITFSSIT